jgi:type IV pilus assembly protein PilX
MKTIQSQRGVALVISLVLLVVLTLLAVVGMGASTLELTMAGNAQHQESAFEAAEAAVEVEMRRDDIAPLDAPGQLTALDENTGRDFVDADGVVQSTVTGVTWYRRTSPATGWELGGGTKFSAYHFDSIGSSTAPRGAADQHTQGFYVVGPGS